MSGRVVTTFSRSSPACAESCPSEGAIAKSFYASDPERSVPKRIAEKYSKLYRAVSNKYFVDEFYAATFIRATMILARGLAWIDMYIVDGIVNGTRYLTVYLFGHGSSSFDKHIVDGAVNGVGAGAQRSSRAFRRLQTGAVQNYALIMGSGLVLLTAVYLFLKP